MQQMPLPLAHCQRWRNGRDHYRPAGERFDARFAEVQPIDDDTAKPFILQHHYAASYPAARFRAGIFLKTPFQAERLCGVAVLSQPMTQAVIPAYFADLAPNEGIELGRLVLLDELAANAETWMLGRVFNLLRAAKPAVRSIVSYADPEPRYNAAGELVKRGHLGTIYKAHNGQYRGRSRARTLLLMPSGQVANERALSKIRNNECGSAYALRALLGAGAPDRQFGESGRDYLARLEAMGFFRRLRHPGNFCFTWRL